MAGNAVPMLTADSSNILGGDVGPLTSENDLRDALLRFAKSKQAKWTLQDLLDYAHIRNRLAGIEFEAENFKGAIAQQKQAVQSLELAYQRLRSIVDSNILETTMVGAAQITISHGSLYGQVEERRQDLELRKNALIMSRAFLNRSLFVAEQLATAHSLLAEYFSRAGMENYAVAEKYSADGVRSEIPALQREVEVRNQKFDSLIRMSDHLLQTTK